MASVPVTAAFACTSAPASVAVARAFPMARLPSYDAVISARATPAAHTPSTALQMRTLAPPHRIFVIAHRPPTARATPYPVRASKLFAEQYKCDARALRSPQ